MELVPLVLALVVAALCDALLAAGETDLVLGALTAIESAVDAAVFTLVDDPVRRAKAARRGLGAEVALTWIGGVPPLAAAAALPV